MTFLKHPLRITGIQLQAILIFGTTLLFLLLNCDWDGYEGDDLNSIIPMMYLTEARLGLIDIYKYDWQPLGYQLGAIVYNVFDTPNIIFLLPGLFIAASIAVLYLIVKNITPSIHPITFIAITFFTPEIYYTGLYYNSSAAAFLCTTIALYLANGGCKNLQALPKSGLIGALLCCAALFRMEFVLISFGVFYIHLYRYNSWKSTLIAALSASTLGLVALATGLLDIYDLWSSYMQSRQEIIDKSHILGWDRQMKTFVLTTVLSPIGFAVVGIGGLWLLVQQKGPVFQKKILLAVALSPSLLLFTNLLSTKYAMPVLTFVPFLLAYIHRDAKLKFTSSTFNTSTRLITILTLSSLVISLEPTSSAPYITLTTTKTRSIATHDGSRSWGAFAYRMIHTHDINRRASHYTQAKNAFKKIKSSENTHFLIKSDQNYFSEHPYGWVQLQLELTKSGYRGKVIAKGAVMYTIDSNTLIIFDGPLPSIPIIDSESQSVLL